MTLEQIRKLLIGFGEKHGLTVTRDKGYRETNSGDRLIWRTIYSENNIYANDLPYGKSIICEIFVFNKEESNEVFEPLENLLDENNIYYRNIALMNFVDDIDEYLTHYEIRFLIDGAV